MKIYFDHAATTGLNEEVFEKMKPYYCEVFGNPSSQHSFGRQASAAVDNARYQIAKVLNAKPNEIYFTSSGTEGDNWAIKGALSSRQDKKHIITSKVEHPAVMNCLKQLEKEGYFVTYVGVNSDGIVDVDELKKRIREDTALISIMYANNEVGVINPIKEIAKIAHEHQIIFHTDAVQAAGALSLDVVDLGVDLMTISAHKFYGPKGIGVLYIRNGLKMGKLIIGGSQERSMRGGTTNTPLVVGMGEALTKAYEDIDAKNKKIAELRDYLIERILKEIPYSRLNGSRVSRLPNNANISFEFIEGESILLMLDMKGIAVSTGSACSSGELKSSYVLMSMGVAEELAHGSIRFSLGYENTKEEVDYVVDALKTAISSLRAMSPLFNQTKGEDKLV